MESFGILYAGLAYFASEKASAYTNICFGEDKPNADGERANAFKHALWNAFMVESIGVNKAKAIADAHESPYLYDTTIHKGIPNCEHSEMDLYNNAVGRFLYIETSNIVGYPLSEIEIVCCIYAYATSDYAYYRIENDGTIRGINESRPVSIDMLQEIFQQW